MSICRSANSFISNFLVSAYEHSPSLNQSIAGIKTIPTALAAITKSAVYVFTKSDPTGMPRTRVMTTQGLIDVIIQIVVLSFFDSYAYHFSIESTQISTRYNASLLKLVLSDVLKPISSASLQVFDKGILNIVLAYLDDTNLPKADVSQAQIELAHEEGQIKEADPLIVAPSP